ncbi:flavodoxin [Saccharicrinis fermentans]|uniref:Flavodoxin n=1 Tax=Saccharicrinis fermentans DSM 9555 = JCM 21142 TaxID=869213 RepID=W7Y011_9BACT|nr:flavodoxin [Saccharicrinis fermentans]GAF04255.1 flavodoxin [Saccharicrinis fermentans DSM 9555 = JCM 21142]
MKKIGLFYSFNSVKTRQQAEKMCKALGEDNVEKVNVEDATQQKFMEFSNYILAVPTWFDGELPNYWDEFLPSVEDDSLKGKTFALYGGGDQKGYSENFVDGIGIMADFLEARGGKVVGFTSTEGYEFESSRAQRGNEFVGLALDIENQAALSDDRIKNWVEKLKKEFK